MNKVSRFSVFALFFFIISPVFSQTEDPNVSTIKQYYEYLTYVDSVKKAWEMSPKKVPLETFSEWYKNASVVYPFFIVKNSDNTYSFYVHFGSYYGDNYKGKEVILYFVTMEVKNGKIIKSESRTIDEVIMKTMPYKEGLDIQMVNNGRENREDFYLIDKKLNSKKILFYVNYDRFGFNMYYDKIINGYLLIGYALYFEGGNTILYNLNSGKFIKGGYSGFFISQDSRYIFTYESAGMFPGGLRLEIYEGRDIKKDLAGENFTGDTFIIKKENGEDILYCFNSLESKTDFTLKINLNQSIK